MGEEDIDMCSIGVVEEGISSALVNLNFWVHHFLFRVVSSSSFGAMSNIYLLEHSTLASGERLKEAC